MSGSPVLTRRELGGIRREDYALADVPDWYRGYGLISLFSVLLAIPSALVFLAVGGGLEVAYGTRALLWGLVITTIIVSLVGFVLVYAASTSGLDSDLMTIVAGYGYRGSAVTSLIYGVNFLILYSLENAIIVNAVHARFTHIATWPIQIGIGCVLAICVWYGLHRLTRLMLLTGPVALGLVIWLLLKVGHPVSDFWSKGGVDHHGIGIGILQVVAALLAFIVNATVGADVGRFVPPARRAAGGVLLGVGLQLFAFFGATLVGAWLAVQLHGDSNPGSYIVDILGFAGLVYIIVIQVRINSINVYSGSLAFSNFGARALRLSPGRQYWLVGLILCGSILTLTSIYAHLLGVLTFESVFVMAWVMSVAGFLVKRRFWALPAQPWFGRQGLVEEISPRGFAALVLALTVLTPMAFGALGNNGKAWAPVVSGAVALCAAFALHKSDA